MTLSVPARQTRTAAQTAAFGLGVFFAACAVGIAVGAGRDTQGFVQFFRDHTWFGPYNWILDGLKYISPVAVIMAVLFDAVVALMLFREEDQTTGLALATVGIVGLAGAIAWPFALMNVAGAALFLVIRQRLMHEAAEA